MNARERTRVEQINRIAKFGEDNAGDWKAASGGPASPSQAKTADLYKQLTKPTTGVRARLEEFQTGQETGSADFHVGTTSKSVLRHGIMLDLSEWNETAGAIATALEQPAIMDGFRVPHGVSAKTLAAKARAVAKKAEALATEFVALGYEEEFVEQFLERVEAFETAKEEKATGLQKQTGSGGGLSATIADGLKIGKQLNVSMKKLYKNTPEKLAAWNTAFRTERVGPAKKAKTQTPDSPPPPKTP
jgi:hypothetical protein